ncbi:MAG TPA: hypothetical protein VJL28_11290 [Gemmatimonadaceae bacterium]|nr:hypothetical protein [Gemmatimonadaceae bacterium]
MADGTRRSLSEEEHAIRLKFDAATHDGARDLRARLWSELKEVRRKTARRKERLFVRIRFQEKPATISSCLIADLRLVSPIPQASGVSPAHRIDAYVSCELLLDAELPPCERPGPCPHELVAFVLESDNNETDLEKRAWAALREQRDR